MTDEIKAMRSEMYRKWADLEHRSTTSVQENANQHIQRTDHLTGRLRTASEVAARHKAAADAAKAELAQAHSMLQGASQSIAPDQSNLAVVEGVAQREAITARVMAQELQQMQNLAQIEAEAAQNEKARVQGCLQEARSELEHQRQREILGVEEHRRAFQREAEASQQQTLQEAKALQEYMTRNHDLGNQLSRAQRALAKVQADRVMRESVAADPLSNSESKRVADLNYEKDEREAIMRSELSSVQMEAKRVIEEKDGAYGRQRAQHRGEIAKMKKEVHQEQARYEQLAYRKEVEHNQRTSSPNTEHKLLMEFEDSKNFVRSMIAKMQQLGDECMARRAEVGPDQSEDSCGVFLSPNIIVNESDFPVIDSGTRHALTYDSAHVGTAATVQQEMPTESRQGATLRKGLFQVLSSLPTPIARRKIPWHCRRALLGGTTAIARKIPRRLIDRTPNSVCSLRTAS